MTQIDFTKRLAVSKGKNQCKLAMLFSNGVYYLSYFHKEYPNIAYYFFMSAFESSAIAGESGAHQNVVDMEIAKESVMISASTQLRPISVTLNIGLDDYKEMRENKTFIQTRHKGGVAVMPEFEERVTNE